MRKLKQVIRQPIKQYEFDCSCGYIWIDSRNNGCPMCSKTTDISSRDYYIKQPKSFGNK